MDLQFHGSFDGSTVHAAVCGLLEPQRLRALPWAASPGIDRQIHAVSASSQLFYLAHLPLHLLYYPLGTFPRLAHMPILGVFHPDIQPIVLMRISPLDFLLYYCIDLLVFHE